MMVASVERSAYFENIYIHTRFCVGLQSLTNVDLFSGNLIKHFVSLKKQPAMQALSAIGDINQFLQAHIG